MKSKTPPKPVNPLQITQLQNNPGVRSRQVLLGGLIVIFVGVASFTLLLAYFMFEPQIAGLVQLPTPTIVPTATPQCVRSALTLGSYIYPLDEIPITKEGTLPIVPGPAGTAWWLSDTFNPYVIIFAPAIHSVDMQAVLTPGDRMVVQWADCESEEFVYTEFQPESPDIQTLLAHTSFGIAIIVQSVGSAPEYVLYGQRP